MGDDADGRTLRCRHTPAAIRRDRASVRRGRALYRSRGARPVRDAAPSGDQRAATVLPPAASAAEGFPTDSVHAAIAFRAFRRRRSLGNLAPRAPMVRIARRTGDAGTRRSLAVASLRLDDGEVLLAHVRVYGARSSGDRKSTR